MRKAKGGQTNMPIRDLLGTKTVLRPLGQSGRGWSLARDRQVDPTPPFTSFSLFVPMLGLSSSLSFCRSVSLLDDGCRALVLGEHH